MFLVNTPLCLSWKFQEASVTGVRFRNVTVWTRNFNTGWSWRAISWLAEDFFKIVLVQCFISILPENIDKPMVGNQTFLGVRKWIICLKAAGFCFWIYHFRVTVILTNWHFWLTDIFDICLICLLQIDMLTASFICLRY